MTHKFAEHLQREFLDWDVDCEYNRNDEVPKALHRMAEKAAPANDEEGQTVFPDIIVHRRGRTENLMVLEAKKSTNKDGSDKEKLKAFRSDGRYRYLFSIALRFNTQEPFGIDFERVTEAGEEAVGGWHRSGFEMPTTRDYAQEFLHALSTRHTCEWCRHPVKSIYRAGLCRHCYDIRLRVERLRRKVNDFKKRGGAHPVFGPVPPSLDFEYRVALKMKKSAAAEGRAYGRVFEHSITGLDLEYEFSRLSRRFVHQDFYAGEANIFDWSFTPNQKRLIFYMLSLMSRADLRRTRAKRALNSNLEDEN